jgi:hypothetical protein
MQQMRLKNLAAVNFQTLVVGVPGGFTFASIGAIMGDAQSPAENHIRRNARKRHPRIAGLLRRLPMQPSRSPSAPTTGRMI